MRADRNRDQYQPIYPDVLRALTDGPRINLKAIEWTAGVYPRMAYINQPVEVVVALQSMIDEPLPVRVGLRTPNADKDGNVLLIDSARDSVTMTLKPGEVGVMRLPIIARPPTPAVRDLPLRVTVRCKLPEAYNEIRPPGGGAPPSVLSVSPFKVQVLKEMTFDASNWDEDAHAVTLRLDFTAKNMAAANSGDLPAPRYEALWTQTEMQKDIELARSHYDAAIEIARPGTLNTLFYALMDETTERFAARGMPLHPAEAAAVAKMMSYTVEDAPARENLIVENMRWFRSLCQMLASKPDLVELPRHEVISEYIYTDVLHDAIMMAFYVLEYKVDEDLGNQQEREEYAHRLMAWIGGHGEVDLSYLYLPLVLGGVAVAHMVARNWGDDPWHFYDRMVEAYNGRVRLASDASGVVFDILLDLLENYGRRLRHQRIERTVSEPATEPTREPGQSPSGNMTMRGLRRGTHIDDWDDDDF